MMSVMLAGREDGLSLTRLTSRDIAGVCGRGAGCRPGAPRAVPFRGCAGRPKHRMFRSEIYL
jgi:hypothetical protein